MKVAGSAIKLAVFLTLTALTAVFLGNVLADSRTSGRAVSYRAVFANASYLKTGSDVRIAGVTVGKVQSLALRPDNSVVVGFQAPADRPLPGNVRAAVRYKNLLGDRYLELAQGTGAGDANLAPGATIPVSHTTPALDLDILVGGFKPLFQALAPEQINQLSAELIKVFQGESGSVTALLSSVTTLTSSLADHDQVIGSLITNLNTVLGTIDQRGSQVSDLVVQLQQLVSGLSADREPIARSIDHVNDLAGSASGLLAQLRPDLAATVGRLGTVAGTLNANSDLVTAAVKGLPGAYKAISGIGLYGDFFNFFLCDIQVKTTGPNGAPVYTPWIESQLPRCGDQGGR
ncbi:MCE family protein [Amycolatopsis silviterrae]|uniref:MCE family protein n=1 Tax=Amycolatopsis silviterrae TaxID=1656914 RepID=A0ABW5HKD5_9PSEU